MSNKMFTAIIIDDEKLAQNLIAKYLEKFNEINIVAQCNDGFEGLKAITKYKPDIIFLDIQMPKLTGFEMLELIDGNYNIIFTTAYDQYALKAFEVNAIDYLLKPFSLERFSEAVTKVLKKAARNETSSLPEQIVEIFPNKETLNRIVVKKNSKIIIIPITSVIYIEAQDDYVNIITTEGKYLKQSRMKFYEENLPDNFIRVHRSYLVDFNTIKEISLMGKESHVILLKNGDKIPVSKNGYRNLKQLIK